MTVYYAKSESEITLVPPPDPGGGEPPPTIWGPGDPRPTLPISGWDPGTGTWPLPLPPELPDVGPITWKAIWLPESSPNAGWNVIGIPNFPHPTPSSVKKK